MTSAAFVAMDCTGCRYRPARVKSLRDVTCLAQQLRVPGTNWGTAEIDVKKYEKLLAGGIWSIVTIHYVFEEGQKKSPFSISDIKPIQMPNKGMDELFEGRKAFTEDEWLGALHRSTGMEPSLFSERTKWHLLARLSPSSRTTTTSVSWGRGARQEPRLQRM